MIRKCVDFVGKFVFLDPADTHLSKVSPFVYLMDIHTALYARKVLTALWNGPKTYGPKFIVAPCDHLCVCVCVVSAAPHFIDEFGYA